MLARCWRLRRSASHRGRVARLGGRRGGIEPFLKNLLELKITQEEKAKMIVMQKNWVVTYFGKEMLGLWGATHPEQLEFVQSLAGNNGHHLHLADKSHFGRRQAGWKR